MQTNSLPIQLNAANPSGQRSNASNGANGDAAQFGAMLSSEMEARQMTPVPAPMMAASPAPQAAPKQEASKPQAADKPAQPIDAEPATPADAQSAQSAQSAQASQADQAGKADAAKDASKDAGADSAQADAADPAAAMLALMASLQQPVQDPKAASSAKAGAAAQAYDALTGAATGKGKRGDAAQLAALQAAIKSVAREGGTAQAGTKSFADTAALQNPALAAAGAALGAAAQDKPGAAPGAELRDALSALAAKPEARPQPDAADFALQQARETSAQQAPAPALAALQAQPAVMEMAEAAAASENLSARVGTDAWEHQVGQKVVYMVGSEDQTASLTLNPPDLGPLQVVLSVSNDQASVSFTSNQEEVRQALENALPRLREMMSESGIALGNATVNAGMPDGRQAQEQAAQSGRGNHGARGNRGDAGGTAIGDVAARPQARTAILGERGMVDTFA